MENKSGYKPPLLKITIKRDRYENHLPGGRETVERDSIITTAKSYGIKNTMGLSPESLDIELERCISQARLPEGVEVLVHLKGSYTDDETKAVYDIMEAWREQHGLDGNLRYKGRINQLLRSGQESRTDADKMPDTADRGGLVKAIGSAQMQPESIQQAQEPNKAYPVAYEADTLEQKAYYAHLQR